MTDVSTNKGDNSDMAPQQTLTVDSSADVINMDTEDHQHDVIELGEADLGSSRVAAYEQGVSREGHEVVMPESSNLEIPDHQSSSAGSGTASNHEMSDAESPASREEDASEPTLECEMRERRDSGVGSSLTRAPR